jgi:hypothetical protein
MRKWLLGGLGVVCAAVAYENRTDFHEKWIWEKNGSTNSKLRTFLLKSIELTELTDSPRVLL